MPLHCIRCKAEIEKSFRACPRCGEPLTDFLRRYLDEPIDGKYEIIDRLGAGGMGEVYKVRHTYLGALRVVKVIRAQISESQEAHERFLREARLATKVQHPNVATLHDFSALPDGSHYMVWEYIEGENLAQRLKTRKILPPRNALGIALQALRGLDAIHRAGIIHRDMSPENLMITRDSHGDEQVKIIDLGVAKAEEGESGTRTGIFVGKLRYASPEHLGFLNEGERIDGRADLYSLSVVLYEMLAGRPPFEATSPHEYFLHHSRESQFRPLDIPPGLPGSDELQRILQRGLERDRNKRFANAHEFTTALEAVERTLPDPHVMKTLALTPDTDATMRVIDRDTLQRTTQRSEVAEPTLRTPLPAEKPIAEPPARVRSSAILLVTVAVVAILIGAGGAAIVLLSRPRSTQPAETTRPATASSAASVTAPPAQATVEVAPPAVVTARNSTQPPPSSITAPPTVEAPAPAKPPKREPVIEKPATRTEEPEPRPKREEAPPARAYVDGGDSDLNERLLGEAQQELSGVSRIRIEGTGDPAMTKQLVGLMSGRVTVTSDADVVVHFHGTIERLRLGRKRRAAEATITKGGRVIFRYQLPTEEYRVGDTPAEAFARVLTDVLGR